jgi:hypothetical protein
MLQGWAEFTTPQAMGLGLCAVVFVPLSGILFRQYLRGRVGEDGAERKRRDFINATGKIGNGEVVDIEGDIVIYSYQVAGVSYTASQDLSSLAPLLPAERIAMAGPVSVKYLPRNPGNSIVLSEEWSGLRTRR